MTDIAAQLRTLADQANDLPLEDLLGALESMKARAWSRLVTPRVAAQPIEPDEILHVAAAAQVARRSISWMRKHGHTLPGFRQPTGRGGKVGWSRRALDAWAQAT